MSVKRQLAVSICHFGAAAQLPQVGLYARKSQFLARIECGLLLDFWLFNWHNLPSENRAGATVIYGVYLRKTGVYALLEHLKGLFGTIYTEFETGRNKAINGA